MCSTTSFGSRNNLWVNISAYFSCPMREQVPAKGLNVIISAYASNHSSCPDERPKTHTMMYWIMKGCLLSDHYAILESHYKFRAETCCLEPGMAHWIAPCWSICTSAMEQRAWHVDQAAQINGSRDDNFVVFAVDDLCKCVWHDSLVLLFVHLGIDWMGFPNSEWCHRCAFQKFADFIELLLIVSLNSNPVWSKSDFEFWNHDAEYWPAARGVWLISNVSTVVEANLAESFTLVAQWLILDEVSHEVGQWSDNGAFFLSPLACYQCWFSSRVNLEGRTTSKSNVPDILTLVGEVIEVLVFDKQADRRFQTVFASRQDRDKSWNQLCCIFEEFIGRLVRIRLAVRGWKLDIVFLFWRERYSLRSWVWRIKSKVHCDETLWFSFLLIGGKI